MIRVNVYYNLINFNKNLLYVIFFCKNQDDFGNIYYLDIQCVLLYVSK